MFKADPRPLIKGGIDELHDRVGGVRGYPHRCRVSAPLNPIWHGAGGDARRRSFAQKSLARASKVAAPWPALWEEFRLTALTTRLWVGSGLRGCFWASAGICCATVTPRAAPPQDRGRAHLHGKVIESSAINGTLMIEPTQHLNPDRDPATPTIVHHGGRTTTLLSPPHPCPTRPRLLNSYCVLLELCSRFWPFEAFLKLRRKS